MLQKLTDGEAEAFGAELVRNKQYELTHSKMAIFSWQGCVVTIEGRCQAAYLANETPMVQYLNLHTAVEQRRAVAEAEGRQGPRVMLVGPTSAGKSTLAQMLINWAVRQQRVPL